MLSFLAYGGPLLSLIFGYWFNLPIFHLSVLDFNFNFNDHNNADDHADDNADDNAPAAAGGHRPLLRAGAAGPCCGRGLPATAPLDCARLCCARWRPATARRGQLPLGTAETGNRTRRIDMKAPSQGNEWPGMLPEMRDGRFSSLGFDHH